jgi:hypothetical protein
MILALFSCKKTPEPEETNVFGEIIYTDSFSPTDWENPVGRLRIESQDKDIGKIIKQDTLDQKYLKVYEVINNFVNNIQTKKYDEIQKHLTPAAYNSFNLRLPVIPQDKKFNLRVAYPENVDADKYWVDFKIMFQNRSVIAKIEIEKSGKGYMISDFESKFFTDLSDVINNKAVKPKNDEDKKK